MRRFFLFLMGIIIDVSGMDNVDFYDDLKALEERISGSSSESMSLEDVHEACKKDSKFMLLPHTQEIVMKEINGDIVKAVGRDKKFSENNEFIKIFNRIFRYLASACNSLYLWNLKSKISEQIIVNVNSILLAERRSFEVHMTKDDFLQDLSFFTSVLNNQIVDFGYKAYSKKFWLEQGAQYENFLKAPANFSLFDNMYEDAVWKDFLLPFQLTILNDLYKRSEIFLGAKKDAFCVYIKVYQACAGFYNALYLIEREELKRRGLDFYKSNIMLTEYAIERLNSIKDLLFRKDF